MTEKQFYAAVRKRFRGQEVVIDEKFAEAWVDGLLQFMWKENGMIWVRNLGGDYTGEGKRVNDAIQDLRKIIREEINECKESLDDIKTVVRRRPTRENVS